MPSEAGEAQRPPAGSDAGTGGEGRPSGDHPQAAMAVLAAQGCGGGVPCPLPKLRVLTQVEHQRFQGVHMHPRTPPTHCHFSSVSTHSTLPIIPTLELCSSFSWGF